MATAKQKLTTEEMKSKQFVIKGAKISWVNLYEKEVYRETGEVTQNYSATFIIDKEENPDFHMAYRKAAAAAIRLHYRGTDKDDRRKIADLPKAMQFSSKNALKDGDEGDYEPNKGKYTIKAMKRKNRPTTLGRDGSPVVAEDAGDLSTDPDKEGIARTGIFYPGAIVNAVVSLWIMDGPSGQWIGCNLEAVRFVRDGEPLTGAGRMSDDDAADLLMDDDEMSGDEEDFDDI